MKYLGIVSVVALASLSCQKDDGETPGGTPAASAREGKAVNSPVSGSSDPASEGLATKSSERPAKKEKTIWVAEPVDGKPGYVKSPFSGKIIDVKGIPAGALVADPTFPAAEKKHFRVPEVPEEEMKKANAAVARPLPGKQGFVFSPLTNKIIDVSGMEPGSVVTDPTAPEGETHYLKVPDETEPDSAEAADE